MALAGETEALTLSFRLWFRVYASPHQGDGTMLGDNTF
jgi:hypothetical protein